MSAKCFVEEAYWMLLRWKVNAYSRVSNNYVSFTAKLEVNVKTSDSAE